MKVLLTGATGFIGSHLARLLVLEGHQVIAIVRSDSQRTRLNDIEPSLMKIEADLKDLSNLRPKLGGVVPDICVHLAWKGKTGFSPQSLDNLDSALWSFEFIRSMAELGCRRIVVAGTCWEYDPTHEYMSETTPVKPHDPYGASKLALYYLTKQLADVLEIDVAWPRIFNLFGPFEDRQRMVPSIVLALLKNKVALMTPGDQMRDYLHVEDVASAIWAVAKSRLTGPINIASGNPVSVREIALEIGAILCKPQLLGVGMLSYRENDPMLVCAKVDKLQTEIGWLPRFDLHRGLAQTIEWWQKSSRENQPPF